MCQLSDICSKGEDWRRQGEDEETWRVTGRISVALTLPLFTHTHAHSWLQTHTRTQNRAWCTCCLSDIDLFHYTEWLHSPLEPSTGWITTGHSVNWCFETCAKINAAYCKSTWWNKVAQTIHGYVLGIVIFRLGVYQIYVSQSVSGYKIKL